MTTRKKYSSVRRWLPWLGALLLVGLIIAGLRPRPVPVEITRVTVGPLRATVNEEGKTRIRQRYAVSAPVTGQLRRIPFKAGAPVVAGETVVAMIDPISPALLDARSRAAAEARRDESEANVNKARVTHDQSVTDLRRADQLAANKTISPQELDAARWKEAAAAKDLAAAESAFREAVAQLAVFAPTSQTNAAAVDPVEVKAPATGQVLHVFEESARVVTMGTPLVEIGDSTDLEVVIEVLSRDGALIVPSAPVELDQWGGGEPLQGKVRLVEPAAFTKVSALGVEEQRVNVIADLVTPPDQRRSLGDAFRVEAKILLWESDHAVKVPSGALFRRGDVWSAFVVEAGHARLRPVQVGRSSGAETQIVGGLNEGDEIILYPGDRVQDGVAVNRIVIQ